MENITRQTTVLNPSCIAMPAYGHLWTSVQGSSCAIAASRPPTRPLQPPRVPPPGDRRSVETSSHRHLSRPRNPNRDPRPSCFPDRHP